MNITFGKSQTESSIHSEYDRYSEVTVDGKFACELERNPASKKWFVAMPTREHEQALGCMGEFDTLAQARKAVVARLK